MTMRVLKGVIYPLRFVFTTKDHLFVDNQSKKIEVIGKNCNHDLSFLLHKIYHELMQVFYPNLTFSDN